MKLSTNNASRHSTERRICNRVVKLRMIPIVLGGIIVLLLGGCANANIADPSTVKKPKRAASTTCRTVRKTAAPVPAHEDVSGQEDVQPQEDEQQPE